MNWRANWRAKHFKNGGRTSAMINQQKIALIIPALNEAGSIAKVIADLPHCIDRIIVVDNGSTDCTAMIAVSAGATVIKEREKGYGAACLKGISVAGDAELIAFIDGDFSDYPHELLQIIEPVALGECELSMGIRNTASVGVKAVPWHQKWGTWFLCQIIGVVHGYCYRDLGPMRCIRADTLNQLNMQDRNYGWTVEMQLKVSKRGDRIKQVDVGYRPRIGRSKISGTLKGTLLAAYKILLWTFKLALPPRLIDSRQR